MFMNINVKEIDIQGDFNAFKRSITKKAFGEQGAATEVVLFLTLRQENQV